MIQGEIVEITDTIATVQLDPMSLTFLDNCIPEKAASALAFFPKHNAIGPKMGDTITAGRGRWNSFAEMIVLEHINIIETNMNLDIPEDTTETTAEQNTEPTQSNTIMKIPDFSRPPPYHLQRPQTNPPKPTANQPETAQECTKSDKRPSPENKRTISTSDNNPNPKKYKIVSSDTENKQFMSGHAVMIMTARPTEDDSTKPYSGLLRTDWKPWNVPATTALWAEVKLIEGTNKQHLKSGIMTTYMAMKNPQQNQNAELIAQQVGVMSNHELMNAATFPTNKPAARQPNLVNFYRTWSSLWMAGIASETHLNAVASEGSELINVKPKYDNSQACLTVYAKMPEIKPFTENDTGGRLNFSRNDDIMLLQKELRLQVKGVVTDITDIEGKEYLAVKFDMDKSIHLRAFGLIQSELPVDIIKQEDNSFLKFLVETLRRLPHQLGTPSSHNIYEVGLEFFGKTRSTAALPDSSTIEPNYLSHQIMPDFIPNIRQQQVAKLVLDGKGRVYTVAGPAGTGKTRWAAATTLQMIHQHPQSTILLSGENNNTVDNSFEVIQEIACRDPTSRIRPLRLYAPSREHGVNRCDAMALHQRAINPPEPTANTKDIYETMRPQIKQYKQLEEMITTINWSTMSVDEARKAKGHVHQTRKQMQSIHKDLCSQFLIIYKPNIIVATLTTIADTRLLNIEYDAIFIDEAASAKEMSIVLSFPKLNKQSQIGKVIIIGDRKQLPAVVLTQGEAGKFMQRSAHERIEDHQISTTFMFNVCYRMSPQLLRCPNIIFYDGLLQSALTSTERTWHQSVYPFPVKTEPVLLDWIEGTDNITQGFSRSNEEEACAVLDHFRFLIERDVECTSISILCMYEGQRRLIGMKIRQLLYSKGLRSHPILVMNVDGMQGLENDFVIVSLVRSSEKCRGNAMPDAANWRPLIGFLSDKRRTNVAITRARHGLIIVADIQTVRVAPQYAHMIRDLITRKCVRKNYTETLCQLTNTPHEQWYNKDKICKFATTEPSSLLQLITDATEQSPKIADDEIPGDNDTRFAQSTQPQNDTNSSNFVMQGDHDMNFPPLQSTSQ